ncbi:DeoR family transcriptional regulator [Aliidongia dinghuensis]|uniref:DeoR family transcriptional regulator n=1 Tax=Aliidongia dinghuensis TaxID=1867774 RepID=A0A8J3E2N8_9PROT|nr:DeoR/GlpR family DNA-binding transcription regulator [Aliidongia dinghuensis]GGF12534.1 DeoR family transcriptional regulator [Aliidongia dinghuensis]
MRSKERRAILLDTLRGGEVDVEALAERFGVSASTVRRDLQQLSSANAICRTYGGAILAHAAPEASLSQRQQVNSRQKTAIARAALALLADDDALILDAGSTVAAFGLLLKPRRHRIVTNNLSLVAALSDAPDIALTVLGGTFRATSVSTVGPLALDGMRRMTADKLFTSADGVVAGRGLCEASLEQAALKSLMINQAREVVVLADATKLARGDQDFWAELPPRWTLVTDDSTTDEQCAPFAAAGARVIRAEA